MNGHLLLLLLVLLVLLVLLLVLLIPTVLWYMYESVPQYQYWLTDFAVCRYIPSVYSICACASLHAHCKYITRVG